MELLGLGVVGDDTIVHVSFARVAVCYACSGLCMLRHELDGTRIPINRHVRLRQLARNSATPVQR